MVADGSAGRCALFALGAVGRVAVGPVVEGRWTVGENEGIGRDGGPAKSTGRRGVPGGCSVAPTRKWSFWPLPEGARGAMGGSRRSDS